MPAKELYRHARVYEGHSMYVGMLCFSKVRIHAALNNTLLYLVPHSERLLQAMVHQQCKGGSGNALIDIRKYPYI